MAEYIREHGFSQFYIDEQGCGCFMHADMMVNCPNLIESASDPYRPGGRELLDVINSGSFQASPLERSGWTAGCTDDAAAACEIAADIIEAGG